MCGFDSSTVTKSFKFSEEYLNIQPSKPEQFYPVLRAYVSTYYILYHEFLFYV